MKLLGGIRIIESVQLVDGPFEDWSQVRSHGRARRRRKQGHPQRIRLCYTPSNTAMRLPSGDVVMHPEMARQLRACTEGTEHDQG